MTTEELNIKITADTSAATSNIGKAEKSVNELGKSSKGAADKIDKLDKSVTTTGGSLRNFGQEANTAGNRLQSLEGKANGLNFSGLKSTLVGLGLGRLLKESVTNAMNAVESESLFETSLGGLSSQARSWSEKLSSDLGLDGYALRKNVGMLYTMTSSMGLGTQTAYEMSTSLTQLAEDMASFYNLSSDEAFAKLKSGLTGEAEPLKALGILVDENTVKQYAYKTGIAEVGSELTQQQKVLARYQAILGQTATAQGDLARTADSPSNQLRRTMNELQQASVEFGTALMPLVQVALPIARTIISDLSPVINDVAKGVATLGGVLKLMDNPAIKAIAYTAAAVSIVKKLNTALGAPTSKLMLILTLLAAFVGKFGTVKSESISDIAPEMDNAADATDNATDSANDFAKGLGEVEKAAARLASFDKITKLNGSSGDTLASKIVNENDLNNLDKASETIEGLKKNSDIEVNVKTPDIKLPDIKVPDIKLSDIEVPEIDWDTLLKNFQKWIDETDWNAEISKIGKAFEDVMTLAFSIIDGIFGTHLREWFLGVQDYWHKIGLDLELKTNPTDEGLRALEKYEADNGKTAWSEFVKLYDSGKSPKDAFYEVFNTPNLQKGFLAVYASTAGSTIREWQGMSQQQIAQYLNKERKVGDLEEVSLRINDDSFMGISGNFKSLVYDAFADYRPANTNQNIIDFMPVGPYLTPPSFAGLSPNISPSDISSPFSVSEIYKALSAAGAPSSVIRIQTDVNLDGEKIGEAVYDYDSKKSAATNGR